MNTWYERAFRPGVHIQGKWNGQRYLIERLLGAGSNGLVVLVRKGKHKFALKTGYDTIDFQSEINSLHALSRTDTSFQNFLIDVDDWSVDGKEVPFCVMRYIEGRTVTEFLQKRGQDWIYVIGTKLLKKLTELHQSGYVFGDLKMENMIVSGYGDVELIDFGGVTPKGRSIKQLTEMYDRGYWMAGERFAEESYDLFSFAILILKALDNKKRFSHYPNMLPQNREIEQLQMIMREHAAAHKIAPFLNKALNSEFSTSEEAFRAWKKLVENGRQQTAVQKQVPWLQICFAASLFIFGATLYIYW